MAVRSTSPHRAVASAPSSLGCGGGRGQGGGGGGGGWVVFLPDQVDEGEVEWQSAVRPLTGQWLQLLHLWDVGEGGGRGGGCTYLIR